MRRAHLPPVRDVATQSLAERKVAFYQLETLPLEVPMANMAGWKWCIRFTRHRCNSPMTLSWGSPPMIVGGETILLRRHRGFFARIGQIVQSRRYRRRYIQR